MASQKPYLAAEKGRGHNTDPWPGLGEDSTLWLVPPNQGTWPHGVREAKEKEVICHLYFNAQVVFPQVLPRSFSPFSLCYPGKRGTMPPWFQPWKELEPQVVLVGMLSGRAKNSSADLPHAELAVITAPSNPTQEC